MDILLIASLVFLAIALFFAYVLLGGFLSGAGYQPTPMKTLEKMMEFSDLDEKKKVFDLGSGFGRIVIEVAQRYHATCVGVEVDPLKVWWSRRSIRRKGLEGYAKIVRSNLMDVDISSADVVYVFLWEGIMQRLKVKALAQMKPGSAVVSYYHKFDGWKPEKEESQMRVYRYRIPARN
jgi:ribosomal protein L11 methylase PrmA